MTEFTYLEAGKYIFNEWTKELWDNKTTLIPAILLTYISSTQAEETITTCAQDLRSCKDDYALLVHGSNKELNQCQMSIGEKHEEIIKYRGAIIEILELICRHIEAANLEMPQFCTLASIDEVIDYYKNSMSGYYPEGEL